MRYNPVKKLALLLCAISLFGGVPAQANEEAEWLKDLKSTAADPGAKESATSEAKAKAKSQETFSQDSSDLATINDMNPTDLRSHASAHLKDGEYDAAIKLVERAIELQPEDTDGRQIYADALEQKVKVLTVSDPHTYNQCIKQWYYLYKNAEYPEMCSLAAKHLKDLTGKSPFVWPTPRMYFNRTLMPEDGSPLEGPTPAALTEEPTQIH